MEESGQRQAGPHGFIHDEGYAPRAATQRAPQGQGCRNEAVWRMTRLSATEWERKEQLRPCGQRWRWGWCGCGCVHGLVSDRWWGWSIGDRASRMARGRDEIRTVAWSDLSPPRQPFLVQSGRRPRPRCSKQALCSCASISQAAPLWWWWSVVGFVVCQARMMDRGRGRGRRPAVFILNLNHAPRAGVEEALHVHGFLRRVRAEQDGAAGTGLRCRG